MQVVEQPAKCECGTAIAGLPLEAYNASAFRYLLDVERRRADRSERGLVLLLVSLRPEASGQAQSLSSAAAGIFTGLGASVREVDFVGWFRENRVAGAVLAQRGGAPSAEICSDIRNRAVEALADRLPAFLLKRLHVRVVRLNPRKY